MSKKSKKQMIDLNHKDARSTKPFFIEKIPKKRSLNFILAIALAYVVPFKTLAQNLPSASAAISLQGNTGVNVVGTTVTQRAVGLSDNFWTVSTTNLPGPAALIINPPYQNPLNCNQWSPNQTAIPWNQWITHPNINYCGGPPGSYSCQPNNVNELFFTRQFFLPANTQLQIDWGIWASDWVQSIKVNGVYAYNSNISGGGTGDNRQNGVKLKWCNWNAGAMNTIVVHVRMNPNSNLQCKVAGMKVESWGNASYVSISGPTLVCSGTANIYSMPTATSIGLPPSTTYTWTKPPAWTGNSTTYTINTMAGNNSGILSAGMYSITNTSTLCLAGGAYSITVVPPLTVTPTSTVICSGRCATLSVSGANTYTWYAPGNLVVSNSSSAILCPTANTTYTVRGTTSQGCIYSRTIPIVVQPVANITINSSTTTVCRGKPTTLTASSAMSTYTWVSPPSVSTVTNPLIVTPSVTTTYTVSNTNTNGCINTRTITINVIPSPTVTVSGNPTVICAGFSSTLTASGAPSYSWAPITSSASSVVVTPGATTTYSATGTATNGCTGTATVQIAVLGNPLVAVNPPFICAGIVNTLTAFGAQSYTWYIGSPSSSTVANTQSILATPGTFVYSVCGAGANGCISCTTVTLTVGTPIPITANNTVVCTNAGPCTNVTATSTLGGAVNYTWQTSPSPQIGPTANVCPTVATVYTVNATSSLGCPSSATVAVTIATNCCSQSTVGLTVLTGITGTLNNTSFLVSNPINVTGLSRLQNCEIWATPTAQINILPGAVLDLDHVHMFACGNNMWNGIVVQDGGRITSDLQLSRQKNTMIEDAITAIKLDNISSGGGAPRIDIQRFIFNRNYIGIQVSNSAPSVSSLQLGIIGCVFSSRIMPYTTFNPSAANAWASAETMPGSPWGNNPGLKVPSTPTATDGLTPPYLLNGFTQANLKAPYNLQPAHIGIKIDKIGDPNGFMVTPGVEFGVSITNYLPDDFNLFDGLGNGVDVTDASLTLAGNVFQNMQVYNSPTTGGLFGGNGIQDRVTGLMNTQLNLASGNLYTFGNHFWNCVTGVDLNNVYDVNIGDALFRSDHDVSTASMPMIPGDAGVVSNTNRFNFVMKSNQFNNLKNGLVFNTNNGGTLGYSMNGGSSLSGVFSNYLEVTHNYFGPEVLSSDPYTGGGPNTSEYMSDAMQFNTPYTPFWANSSVNSIVGSNKIDRAFRGITLNSMLTEPLAVGGNSIYIEDDYTFGLPGYGIAVYDDARYATIASNTLEAMSSFGNNVSLVYCQNTQGPKIFCNRVTNSNYGFQFEGTNTGTRWEGNTMCGHIAGMALTNNGIIGPQGNTAAPCGNYWDNTCFIPGMNDTYCDMSNPLLSPLAVFTGSYVPVNNSSFGGAPYQVGSSILTTNANNPTNCSNYSYPAPPSWRMASGENSLANVNEEDDFNKSFVNIFPNPTNGQLNILYPEQKEPISATVKDVTGKVLLVISGITNANNVLDVSELPASIYIIELTGGATKTLRYKLVKTN